MDFATLLAAVGVSPEVLAWVKLIAFCATSAVTAASALDAALPHPTAPVWLVRLRAVLGYVAISFGHAKPAGAVEASAAIALPPTAQVSK